ncbi:LOW QUALITY PROTEIN: polyprotein [Phytophthora megakarya]|uniref:Polyprotein n=1 Tax=Phytophthora megakarya TaxID=4795 RepID=A0A225W855_9STRA|nr:LOW QUALITY PROTEIN: polyprotein [Phytophthora megakarya]
MALAHTTQEIIWPRQLLAEMEITIHVRVRGQQGAISIASNQGGMSRAKHIDLRFHFVRDHPTRTEITLHHVPSDSQEADFLTKALPTPQFAKLTNTCGLVGNYLEGECWRLVYPETQQVIISVILAVIAAVGAMLVAHGLPQDPELDPM